MYNLGAEYSQSTAEKETFRVCKHIKENIKVLTSVRNSEFQRTFSTQSQPIFYLLLVINGCDSQTDRAHCKLYWVSC
jgi:hypothetical protein